MSDIIPRSRLDLAALAVHRVLTDKGFTHIFFGGYELQVMGHERGTKDVDVLVKKPFFNGFDKVKQAFVDDSEFLVIEGNRSDAVRAIHSTSSVGIDIMLWDIPKKPITLIGDQHGFLFSPATYLFIRKISCLAMRYKKTDESDLIYLYDNCELDWKKIDKNLVATPERREEAMKNHSDNVRLVEILGRLENSGNVMQNP